MPARAIRRASTLMPVIAVLLVVSLWSVREPDAHGEEQPHSRILDGQANSANHRWTDPMTMYEACAMGSPCFGCQQPFWNTVVNR